MKKLKSILIRLLGRRQYLTLVSKGFFLSFQQGWLRSNPAYRTHYFVRNFIQPGQTVVDIGANLGYYSTEFARLVGKTGKVLAVEPIPLYRSILQKNIRSLPQVEVLPYALGETEGTISMGLPFSDQHRHGLMKVLKEEEKAKAPEVFEVELKNPANLFSNLAALHYLKCDIEGYEVHVLPAMKDVIEKHLPILQVETEGDNKLLLHQLFCGMGYHMCYVGEKGLVPYPNPAMHLPGDMIAIPPNRIHEFASLRSEI